MKASFFKPSTLAIACALSIGSSAAIAQNVNLDYDEMRRKDPRIMNPFEGFEQRERPAPVVVEKAPPTPVVAPRAEKQEASAPAIAPKTEASVSSVIQAMRAQMKKDEASEAEVPAATAAADFDEKTDTVDAKRDQLPSKIDRSVLQAMKRERTEAAQTTVEEPKKEKEVLADTRPTPPAKEAAKPQAASSAPQSLDIAKPAVATQNAERKTIQDNGVSLELIGEIRFPYNSARMDMAAQAAAWAIAEELKGQKKVVIRGTVGRDVAASEDAKIHLAIRRAVMVRKALQEHGIDASFETRYSLRNPVHLYNNGRGIENERVTVSIPVK